MKKRLIILFLFGILLISPFILAQEQSQTYSGFSQFIDNVRLFFTFGQDGKVALSLEIREKEVNSAIVNTRNENNEEAEKNLEKAWGKLQFIQEKVSLNTAEKVKASSSEVLDTIYQEENISDSLEVYSLEEEKTGLTAEWVIEVNGKEGQNLTDEVVVNVSVEQNRVVEIENRIDKIDNEISNWVVEHTYAEGTGPGGEAGVVVEGGLATVVKTEVAQGDDGLKPEVKTSMDVDQNEEPLPEPDLNQINPDLETHDTTTNNIDEGDGGEGDYAEGTTADGVDAGGDGSIGSSEGTNDVAP